MHHRYQRVKVNIGQVNLLGHDMIKEVLDKHGAIRICRDFKSTINQASVTLLPRVDELFVDLSGGKLFTKLDMSSAYLQLPSSNEAYVTNTYKGLLQFNHLPFGVSSAPAIFQRTMETLLRGLSGVSVVHTSTSVFQKLCTTGTCIMMETSDGKVINPAIIY